jgi:hypothetical protein
MRCASCGSRRGHSASAAACAPPGGNSSQGECCCASACRSSASSPLGLATPAGATIEHAHEQLRGAQVGGSLRRKQARSHPSEPAPLRAHCQAAASRVMQRQGTVHAGAARQAARVLHAGSRAATEAGRGGKGGGAPSHSTLKRSHSPPASNGSLSTSTSLQTYSEQACAVGDRGTQRRIGQGRERRWSSREEFCLATALCMVA